MPRASFDPDVPANESTRLARLVAQYRPRVLEASTAAEVVIELVRTRSDPEGVGIMAPKGRTLLVRLDDVPLKAAPLLKQEMLGLGADVAHARGVADHSVARTSAVLIGNPGQYRRLVTKLHRQPFRLSEIGEAVEAAIDRFSARSPESLPGMHRPVPLGDRTRVMGVVNVTPDSFFDGGLHLEPTEAVAHALRLVAEGADLLDIGGESTRPGAPTVSAREELRRIAPVLEALRDASPVPVSVDTRKPEVAKAALELGADLVNDVEALRHPAMRRLIARSGAPAILMHMRGTPATMQRDTKYDDLRGEVYGSLAGSAATAIEAGVAPEQLLIDPGLGFGKSGEQNLELLHHLGEFRSLGLPIVVGASRKSFLGRAQGDAPPEHRLEAGIAAAVLAAREGASILRVHDVGATVRALRLVDAVRRGAWEIPNAGPQASTRRASLRSSRRRAERRP
jgi:dihydropteroate synthase